MKARILTVAGIIHLTVATLLALTFLLGRPVAVSSSILGFTPTFTSSSPTNTPTPDSTSDTPAAPSTRVPPTPEHPAQHLSIVKSASPTEVLPGGQVVFSIRVCNDGNATAASVIVSDGLPSELVLAGAFASQGVVVVEGNGMRAELGALLAGECASVTVVAQVRADVAPGTEIRNVGSVGDLYDDAMVTVVGLLPESGRVAPLAVAAGLLLVGACMLVVGMARGDDGHTISAKTD